MTKRTIVQSIRFNNIQMEKIAWLKSKKINPSVLIRNGFDREFEKFKSNFKKETKEKLPF